MNEKTNTWRALQDLPPAVSSFWCRFNWHTWTKWSDPERVQYSSYVHQFRSCIHCNTRETKKWMHL